MFEKMNVSKWSDSKYLCSCWVKWLRIFKTALAWARSLLGIFCLLSAVVRNDKSYQSHEIHVLVICKWFASHFMELTEVSHFYLSWGKIINSGPLLGNSINGCKFPFQPLFWLNWEESCQNRKANLQNRWVQLHPLTHSNNGPVTWEVTSLNKFS